MEYLAHAVDNTCKLCCPIKSKTFSNNDLKKHWITHEIISNIKKDIILHSTVKIKFLKIFILISEILSPAKLDDQERIILNINSMLQKEI